MPLPHTPSLRLITGALLALCLLTACHNDDDVAPPQEPDAQSVRVNVDVILPADIQEQWQNAIDWALQNIGKAQQRLSRKVTLNLRFHDEDTTHLETLAARLAHPQAGDDTCHAIIGPYHSDNAQTFLSHATQARLPVVMPTCTSAELQRINARNTCAWFLTESDITQCEIMLSTARSLQEPDVALIYTPDTYGKSFADWFAYYAAEQDLHIAGGMTAYHEGDDLTRFLVNVAREAQGEHVRVLVALSNASQYIPVCDQLRQVSDSLGTVMLRPLCADTSYDLQILSADDITTFDYAVTPFASMRYGFAQSYNGHFLHPPMNGEAQIYDALTIIALGAALRMASPDSCIVDDKPIRGRPALTDYMRAIVASWQGVDTQWDAAGLATAFSELSHGRLIDITGASGSLLFDTDTRTKVLNTTYMVWKLNLFSVFFTDTPFSRLLPLIYVSTAGASGETSTTSIWQMEKQLEQSFEEFTQTRRLPPVTDRWAVVISPSTTWANYRHQADAFAMYQLLRQYGYDDDHIVLIVEDNLAQSAANSDFAGQIFVDRIYDPAVWNPLAGTDVRAGAVVDYRFSDLQPDDLADILQGRQSARLPHVIRPDSTSNIFLFWSGHGGSREGPLWGNEDAAGFGTARIRDIVTRMNDANQYRRMMLAVETCYSGKWGEALTGLPDVLVLTAANTMETSKADIFDQQLGVYLSNAFARTFRLQLAWSSNVTLYDLYRELYKTTTGSHVTIYNHQQYGSVYTETMAEYFPESPM